MQKHFIHKSIVSLTNEISCDSYTLSNDKGMQVSMMNFGATITSIKIPIENKMTDIVLGFENAADYATSFKKEGTPYYGSVVGRFAGRIKEGRFSINDKTFQLNKNFFGHHLHGGSNGFSSSMWQTKEINDSKNPSITFCLTSPNADENYPGTLSVEVKYSLTENNELVLDYEASTDQDTIVNLTQHTYFNLDGHDGDVTKQQLYINSDNILETDLENIPTGKFIELDDHHFDFRIPKNCPEKIDHCFVLNSNADPCVVLSSTQNRLKMNVYTDQPGVQVFVGGAYEGKLLTKQNIKYHNNSGICFETQNFPDAPNHSMFPSAVLKKGEKYHHRTLFRFERY